MNILAFCAHPDDIELNVGGTLLKYKKQGHKIFIALTTSGNTGSNIMTDVEDIGLEQPRAGVSHLNERAQHPVA